MAVSTGWTAQQLTEFVAAVSSASDEQQAIRDAVDRAAAAFQARIVAIVGGGEVLASSDPALREVPREELALVATGEHELLSLPGTGPCVALAAPIDDEWLHSLVLARPEELGFSAEERTLAVGMARVLGLTVQQHRLVEAERGLRGLSERQSAENARLVASLAERQRLLERLSRIQSSIVSRRDLDEVFAAIVEGAHDLLGDETVGLRLIDADDPTQLVMVASAGVRPELVRANRRSPLGVGAGGRAAAEGRLVVVEDYAADPRSLPDFAADGIRAALAAPVREDGKVVGSLVVATHQPGRTYSQVEREMLLAFAEHASIALTDAKTVEEKVHQAFHDSLTGLPNRMLVMDRLEHALARASRTGNQVAVLFVDLDTFKNVNDTFGHAAGDEVLRDAANRLLRCVRASDTAARFGGDEFVVLLEDVDDPAVAVTANRILEAMNKPFCVEDREVLIGASIGIAVGSDQADDLLRNADLALYRAKAKGRGQKQVFEPEMHVEMVKRLELEGQLARALREDELVLHYQPIVELRSGRLVGVEALVRWDHPERGLLPPGEFIPVAEDSLLIAPLGRRVLRTACEQLGAWRAVHPSAADLVMAVNFSSAQFNDPGLVEDVQGALATNGVPPSRLVVELTETAFLRDAEIVGARMGELRSFGARIAVDDFGTGNASMRHLAQFPVDVLKVDRSFVQSMASDRRQAAITRSIIALGESLEMLVIGEGIETAEQRDQLVQLGCGVGQGFYLGRPLDAAEIELLLAGAARDGAPTAV